MAQERKRMPQLLVDEVLLLVDTYFQLKNIEDKKERREHIENLSNNMRALPFFPTESQNPEFRSVAGMQMCLANVGFIDPCNKSKFGHGSALQRKVFEYYRDQQEELHKLTKSIVNVAREHFPIDYSYQDSVYGMLLPSYHLHLERKSKVVKAVRRELKIIGQTSCKLCGTDLSKHYSVGEELLEVHIGVPLYKNNECLIVSPSDLLVVCPTCHKLAHSKLDAFDAETLEGYIIQ